MIHTCYVNLKYNLKYLEIIRAGIKKEYIFKFLYLSYLNLDIQVSLKISIFNFDVDRNINYFDTKLHWECLMVIVLPYILLNLI